MKSSNANAVLQKTLRAFSIIEIAVVLAVIGILLSSVIIGKNLVDKAKIANAQTLTTNSVVHSLDKNLVFWHETSFGQESYNNNTWFDYQQDKTKKNNATTTSLTAPQLIEDSGNLINNIPALNFTSSQFLTQPALLNLNNSYFTIFAVHSNASNANDGKIFSDFTNNLNPPIVDGNKRLLIWKCDPSSLITTFTATSKIGNGYTGDIYEIIAFNTQLTDAQFNEVVAYLKAKYRFKITG
ncbi:MAG: type II secretion system protein [Proteobacteria bacterium]|nr:type II secretion system protein [Pseudomonadota bacterium]